MKPGFRYTILVSFIFSTYASLLSAQDAHYYSQQPDSRGTLIGGTGTAGSRELSAVFYNPGIIALFEQSNVGLGGSLYSVDFLNLYEQEGLDRNLESSTFQVIPSIIAGTFKWKKNKKFTTSYAYFNGGYYSGKYSSTKTYEFFENGKAFSLLNRIDYRTYYTEDWIGSGVSYRINEHWGLGVIPYLHMYTSQYMQRGYSDVNLVGDNSGYISGNQDFREARLFSPGLLFNVGVVYNKNNKEFGLTIITPRINVKTFAYSSIERSYLTYNDQGEISISSLLDSDFKSIIKRPFEINIGYAAFHERRALKLRISYYAGIDPYVMGSESEKTIRSGVFDGTDTYGNLPVNSNLSMLNIGIGHEWNVRPDLIVILGARTDFSFFDKGQYKYFDFTTMLIYWNLYHVSAGVDWEYNWLKLSTGVDYAFSYQSGLSQYAAITDLRKPIDDLEFSNSARVSYHQLKVFLGLILSFNNKAE
mgnify:CR=1 FL=1